MRCCQIASPVPLQRWCGFLLVLTVILLFAGGKAILFDTLDPDFFWHYRVAQQLTQDGIGPIVDSISFASMKTPWTPYSWLAELGMKSLWDRFGLTGAIIVQSTMITGIFMLTALCCRQRPWNDQSDEGSRLLPTLLATALAVGVSLPYLSFRPATAATLILALIALLLLRDRRLNERSKMVWVIPALTVLCVNLHFFAIFAVFWTGALFVGSIWEHLRKQMFISPNIRHARPEGNHVNETCRDEPRRDETGRDETGRRLRRAGLVLILTTLGFAMTPMLPGMLKAVLAYRTNDPMVHSSHIAEFAPFWRGIGGAVTGVILLGTLLCISMKFRKLRAGEVLWLCGMLILAIEMGRFLSLAVIILAPLLAWTLPKLSDRPLGSPILRYATACIALMCLGRIGTNLPSTISADAWLNRHGTDAPGYPVEAATFVETNVSPRSHRLISEFSWGGYLAFRLGDQYQVLLDGRTQVHSPEFWKAAYFGDLPQMRQLLTLSEGDAAILPVSNSRFRDALASMGWVSVYKDTRAEVMIPPTNIAKTTE